MKKWLYISLWLVAVGCEDIIDVTLDEAPRAYVVDAWINDKSETQTITLTYTQEYFDSSTPPPVTGATVFVTDDKGQVFPFVESSAGEYVWVPGSSPATISGAGTGYQLTIRADGYEFFAQSQLNRVPTVDSITYTFEEEQSPFEPAGYYAEFVATDLPGPGDTYWIKAYKNGVLLNNPFDLNIAFDAGFNEGGNIDGVVFIQPIQNAVTPLNDDLDEIVPYVPGDSLYVEIHSITNEAFAFLQQVQIQTQRDGGFDEIFAEPLQNVRSNILTTSDVQVVGFFNVAGVSGRGRRLEE